MWQQWLKSVTPVQASRLVAQNNTPPMFWKKKKSCKFLLSPMCKWGKNQFWIFKAFADLHDFACLCPLYAKRFSLEKNSEFCFANCYLSRRFERNCLKFVFTFVCSRGECILRSTSDSQVHIWTYSSRIIFDITTVLCEGIFFLRRVVR